MWSPYVEANHFAYHVTPFLLLLLPIIPLSMYAIPYVTSHLLAVSLCPVPIYALARNAGLHPVLALACGLLFVANYFVGSVQLFIHFEIFLVLFLLCVMALVAHPSRWVWVFVALTLTVKEDAAVLLGAFALYVRLTGTSELLRRRGVRIVAICAVYLACSLAILMLLGRDEQKGAVEYFERLRSYQISLRALLPLAQLLVSFGLLSLFSRWQLLLVLLPMPMFFSHPSPFGDLEFYYSYPFLAPLVLATVTGTAAVVRWMQRHGVSASRATMICCMYLLALAAIQFPLRTQSYGDRRVPFEISERAEYRRRVLRDVLPRDVKTVVQQPLFCFVPNRPDLSTLSEDNVTSDSYVVIDFKAPIGMKRDPYLKLTDRLLSEVSSGTRKTVHRAHDLYILGPAQ